MACSGYIFDPKDRAKYRHPPAPLGFKNLNPPGLRRIEDPDELKFDYEEWANSGILDEPDVTVYDGGFSLNTDSEEDDIVEVPFEPVVKNIEEICIDDDDDEDNQPVPADNIKKEKEESSTENKSKKDKNTEIIESSKAKEVKKEQIAEKIQVIESRSSKEDKVKRKEVKSAEPRISKKPQDKATEEKTYEKHHERKTKKDDEGSRRKKDRPKIKPDVDKSVRTKTKLLPATYMDSDSEAEDGKHQRRGKKHRSPSPRKHRSPSPRKHRSPSPRKHRSPTPRKHRSPSPRKHRSTSPRKHQHRSPSPKKYHAPSPPPSPKKYHAPSPPLRDDYYEEDYKRDYSYFKQEQDDAFYPPTSVKQEFPSVAGVYHCDICNLTLNSAITFKTHLDGKRHKKNLDAKNVAQTVAKSYVPTKPTSKCPNPPPGFKRIDSNYPAKIQQVVDEKLTTPCPALHKVTEIQSLPETSYYCTLCDAPCSVNSILPHLGGFKHQLNCLKHYDIQLYDDISYRQKYQIENIVLKKLNEYQRIHGRGRLKVQMDVPDNGSYDPTSIPSTSFQAFSMPSTSSKPSTSSRSKSSSRDEPGTSREGSEFVQLYQEYSQPDPSKAGFYCRLCLSHSNSEMMWKAHINGKRHIANLKKAPGTAPSKSRNVPAPSGTRPRLYDQLVEVVDEPIVGLDQIREIQRLDIDSVSYTCFLCGGISVCDGEIVDHILLTKHREKYLEKIQYPELETLRSCQMSENGLSSLIAEMCEKVEFEMGRGVPEVYYAKNSLVKL